MIQYSYQMQIFSTIIYVLCLAIALVIKHFYKDKDFSKKHIPLYIIGGIIVLFEICKQIRNFSGYNYRFIFAMFRGMTNEFDAYALPFHFCSFFIVWTLFQLIFMKNKKITHFLDNMSFLWSTIIVLLMFLYPDMIYQDEVDRIFNGEEIIHSIYFHTLALLYWLVDLLLQVYDFKLREIYQAPLCILIYGALAIPAAHIFKKNFCSIYDCEGWSFLEGVFNKGYAIYDGLLIIVGIILSSLIYLVITGIEKIRKSFKGNKYADYGYYFFLAGIILLFLISIITKYTVFGPLYSIWLLLIYLISFIPAIIVNIKNKNA